MKFEELLDLTLREILENYCIVRNLECCFIYGVFKNEDIDRIFNEYNIEKDYPEAFNVENLIHDEVVLNYEDIKDYDALLRIMDNLGKKKKT